MSSKFIVRQAISDDYVALSHFLSYEYFTHRHLDWRSALDWLGQPPFVLVEQDDEILGCFAAPNEVPSVAWVRLFSCSAKVSRREIWELCLQKALPLLPSTVTGITALGIESWFDNLLRQTSFEIIQEIVVFERLEQNLPELQHPEGIFIRQMEPQDLRALVALDALCFPPLWQMPVETFQLAYLQSGYASVIELNDQLIAYQITTESLSSAHLARIAVLPQFQRSGVAAAILADMITYFKKRNVNRITVNTQNDNLNSQALYKKFGFQQEPERYPVFLYQL